VKQDAVPGRLAQLWFKAEQEGIYFGQCSELCGKDRACLHADHRQGRVGRGLCRMAGKAKAEYVQLASPPDQGRLGRTDD
jgi:hypothetical protein